MSLDENGNERIILWGGQLDLMIEARNREDGKRVSLIDIDAYKEMEDLHNFILNITVEPPEKYAKRRIEEGLQSTMSFYDLCSQYNITDARVEKMAARAC